MSNAPAVADPAGGLPVIALVGRTNVGKSTLFNFLTRTRDALVADMPGLTRDRQYGFGKIGPRDYLVVDTGGLSGEKEGIAAFIWAGLSFFVGLMLWQVVDQPLGSAAAGIVLGLMGGYLIFDRVTSHGKNMLVFKAGVGDMKVEVRNEDAKSKLDSLIHRLFELKDERDSGRYRDPSRFALR